MERGRALQQVGAGQRRRKPAKTLADLAAELERLSIPCPATGCYLWLGPTHEQTRPYGTVWFRGKTRGAHRIAWELKNGPIEVGLYVCHRCDVPACVNPDHLFLGEPKRNVSDMIAKGRNFSLPRSSSALAIERQARGEKVGSAKLTESDVRAIRQSADPLRKLARQYGVVRSNIQDIKHRRTWAHVQ